MHLYEPSDGGLDRVAILLANGFHRRGVSTELWLAKREGPNAGLVATDLPLRIIPASGGRRGLALAAQLPALRRAVRRHRPKVLLSAGNQSNLPVALACLGMSTVAVGKLTNPVDRPSAKGAVRRWRFARATALVDLMLVLSQADATRYAAQTPRARFAFVRNPYVIPAMFALAPNRACSPSSRIVGIGRLAKQKDQATLLDALALLRHRDWRLTLVGDGPLRGDLERQAARLGIAARVTFTGYTDPLPHLIAADLLVLSSRWEGLPAVALEALASGLPVVTTDCSPGLAELLRDLPLPAPTPVGDAEALAVAIDAALGASVDPLVLRDAAAGWGVDAAIDDHLRLLAPWL